MCGNACRVFSEAWHQVKGMKKSLWGAVAIAALIGMGGIFVLGLLIVFGQAIYLPNLFDLINKDPYFFLSNKFVIPLGLIVIMLLYHIGQALFEMLVLLPMRMGVFLVPLRHIAGKSTSALYVFKLLKWHYIWRFAVLEAIIVLILGIPAGLGLALFYIPKMFAAGILLKLICYTVGTLLYLLVIYLSVAYVFAPLLIIDRNLSPLEAMRVSRRAVTKRWFCVLGALIWMSIALVIGTLLLFIGLIWAVPYTQNIMVILYRDLTGGIEGKDPVTLCEAK